MEFNEKGNLIFNPAGLMLPNAYFNQQPWKLYDPQSPCLSSYFELQDPHPKDAHGNFKTYSYLYFETRGCDGHVLPGQLSTGCALWLSV